VHSVSGVGGNGGGGGWVQLSQSCACISAHGVKSEREGVREHARVYEWNESMGKRVCEHARRRSEREGCEVVSLYFNRNFVLESEEIESIRVGHCVSKQEENRDREGCERLSPHSKRKLFLECEKLRSKGIF